MEEIFRHEIFKIDFLLTTEILSHVLHLKTRDSRLGIQFHDKASREDTFGIQMHQDTAAQGPELA